MDGNNIRALQLHWLRSQIGLVSQEPVLFATSILENLRYGNQDATLDQARSAAKVANAIDFIEKLPEGFHTLVRACTQPAVDKRGCTLACHCVDWWPKHGLNAVDLPASASRVLCLAVITLRLAGQDASGHARHPVADQYL